MRTYDHFFAEFLNEVSPVHLGAFTPAHLCQFEVRRQQNSILEVFLGNLVFEAAGIAPCLGNPIILPKILIASLQDYFAAGPEY